MIEIMLPDNSIRRIENPITVLEFAKTIGSSLGKATVGAIFDGVQVDSSFIINRSGKIEIITLNSEKGIDILRHSAAHIMAQAVQRVFPGTKVTIGPVIENGFFYDFDPVKPFAEEDLIIIEKEMEKIVKENHQFTREEMTAADAKKLFAEMGEDYKQEIIDDLGVESVSIYKQGEFVDLCRGTHLPSTGYLKAFKLMSTAGAYWRGDENRPQLQRIYGTAWETKKDLEDYLHRLEEAEKRDHRKLGKELGLFSTESDLLGGGLVLWHPKGAIVRHLVESFWKEEHLKNDYQLVYTPHVGRSVLWQTSGHLDFYKESMYSPIDIEGQEYYLKPMNCPFHILIYKSELRSYRQLPLRMAEMGTVYRFERTGVLHGLLRVRGFTQDDAHHFVQPAKLLEDIDFTLNFCLHIVRSFGLVDFKAFLSTRPKGGKAVGSEENWTAAEKSLEDALKRANIEYDIDEGGGAFYGPKIDLKFRDAIGREWQLSTIQFDFNLPERFDVTYIGEDGKPHRPYMVHRALLGSMERFFGTLIEQYSGAFPVWLAPIQVRLLPIADRHNDYCFAVKKQFREVGLRVDVDDSSERLGNKVRIAQNQKIPYILVVGDKELEQNKVAVRLRTGQDLGPQSINEFLSMVKKAIDNKQLL